MYLNHSHKSVDGTKLFNTGPPIAKGKAKKGDPLRLVGEGYNTQRRYFAVVVYTLHKNYE